MFVESDLFYANFTLYLLGKNTRRVGKPLIFFYLGGGRKSYFFSGGCYQISI
jgi:hypothetical protein